MEEIENFYQDLEFLYPQVKVNIPLEKEDDKKPVLILTGFSGSGKDTVIEPFFRENEAYHVVTATTRKRREGESQDAYIWMRNKKENETEAEYYINLRKEYELIEYDEHYGNFYGLPMSSLQKDGLGIPIIRTDIKGTITLKELLPNHGFQPICIAVMPDSWEQVYQGILKRNTESEEEAKRRFKEDIVSSQLYKKYINFFIQNSRNDIESRPGLELAIEGMKFLIDKFRDE